ncbi:uncharacterized protein PG998_008740 [Apiospora kogelbergensis]|uniref:uncharacterized protein n=1 Tax=Apiospora kogelbergensis TaxID=1337665 RepID=UPI003131BC6C
MVHSSFFPKRGTDRGDIFVGGANLGYFSKREGLDAVSPTFGDRHKLQPLRSVFIRLLAGVPEEYGFGLGWWQIAQDHVNDFNRVSPIHLKLRGKPVSYVGEMGFPGWTQVSAPDGWMPPLLLGTTNTSGGSCDVRKTMKTADCATKFSKMTLSARVVRAPGGLQQQPRRWLTGLRRLAAEEETRVGRGGREEPHVPQLGSFLGGGGHGLPDHFSSLRLGIRPDPASLPCVAWRLGDFGDALVVVHDQRLEQRPLRRAAVREVVVENLDAGLYPFVYGQGPETLRELVETQSQGDGGTLPCFVAEMFVGTIHFQNHPFCRGPQPVGGQWSEIYRLISQVHLINNDKREVAVVG